MCESVSMGTREYGVVQGGYTKQFPSRQSKKYPPIDIIDHYVKASGLFDDLRARVMGGGYDGGGADGAANAALRRGVP